MITTDMMKTLARALAQRLGVSRHSRIEMQASSPTIWSSRLRLFRAVLPVDVTEYIRTGPLNAFSDSSLATRLKKLILSRPVVERLCHLIGGASFVPLGIRSETDVFDMLESHRKYNLVCTVPERGGSPGIKERRKTRIIISRIKHLLTTGYDQCVVFAGEIWKDSEGVVHITGNSGTYRPADETVDAFIRFLKSLFPHLKIVKDIIRCVSSLDLLRAWLVTEKGGPDRARQNLRSQGGSASLRTLT